MVEETHPAIEALADMGDEEAILALSPDPVPERTQAEVMDEFERLQKFQAEIPQMQLRERRNRLAEKVLALREWLTTSPSAKDPGQADRAYAQLREWDAEAAQLDVEIPYAGRSDDQVRAELEDIGLQREEAKARLSEVDKGRRPLLAAKYERELTETFAAEVAIQAEQQRRRAQEGVQAYIPQAAERDAKRELLSETRQQIKALQRQANATRDPREKYAIDARIKALQFDVRSGHVDERALAERSGPAQERATARLKEMVREGLTRGYVEARPH